MGLRNSASGLRFLAGGGEMGEAIRERDWSSSPIGPPESWPQSLRAALSIMLHAHYPINVYWGPQLVNFYNDAYLPIVGTKHPDALGRPLAEVWPEVWSSIEAALDGVLARGEPFFAENVQQFVTRSGFAEEIFMTFSYGPIFDADGAIGGVFAAGTEATGTVIGQRRLRLLRDLGSESATSTDRESACQTMAGVLQSDREDVPFSIFYLPAEDGSWRPVAQSGFECEVAALPILPADAPEGEVGAGDTGITFPPGPWDDAPTRAGCWRLRLEPTGPAIGLLVCGFSSRRPLDAGYRDFHSLLVEQTGRVLAGAQAVALAEQRRRELEEIDSAKTEFLATVSHEFRTPLTLILGPLSKLLASDALDPSVARELEVVRANAARLQRLVSNLLEYAQAEAGRLDARFAPWSLEQVVRETAALFGSAFEQQGLDWSVECDELAEPVWLDRRLFEHILLNLLSNALKFTPDGRVVVRVTGADGGPVVEVEDTGVGIAEEELPLIFERFRHREPAGTRSHDGAGIGLALVAELVRLHGGKIEVDSTPGRGSCFRVRFRWGCEHLPADQLTDEPTSSRLAPTYAAEVPRRRAPTPSEPPEAGRRHILVVDDHPDMRDYLRDTLGGDFTVSCAADAAEASRIIDRGVPECVVTDIMLPGVDGISFLRELRSRERTRDVPVVLVSARADEKTRLAGLQAGADDFVVKPFSAPELLERVRRQVESSVEVARRERALRLQAESAERAKSAFLANMSHEIRTPLSNIALAAQLAAQQVPDGPAATSLSRILSSANRLGELLEGVLTLARLQAGSQIKRPDPTTLGEVVVESVDMCRRDAGAKGLSLETDVTTAGAAAHAMIEPSAVSVVVRNLVSNAIKFTDEGAVRVRLDADDYEVAIQVIDTGRGIKPDYLPSLFRPFSQEEEGWSRTREGAGLGLAITQRLVAAHRGRVEVTSEPGEGSCFTVLLPRAFATPVADAGAGAAAEPQELRLLLAEDQDDAREMLAALLEEMGEITAVANGEEAVSTALAGEFDLLLLDINLGGRLTGEDVVRRLRETEQYGRTPAIAITAYAMPGHEERLLRSGFDAYLAKPLNMERLKDLVRKLSRDMSASSH